MPLFSHNLIRRRIRSNFNRGIDIIKDTFEPLINNFIHYLGDLDIIKAFNNYINNYKLRNQQIAQGGYGTYRIAEQPSSIFLNLDPTEYYPQNTNGYKLQKIMESEPFTKIKRSKHN